MLLATALALCDLSVCASVAICTLYVTESKAQSPQKAQPQAETGASPIYGITMPAGYRDWRMISLAQVGPPVNDLRVKHAAVNP